MKRTTVQWAMTLEEKLEILSDAAKYDVSCTSSGSERTNDGKGMGNGHRSGICHAFSGDGRCISLLKILMSNDCCYDCRYCISRVSNDVPRATFTPEEICTLTMEFYRRNYIEGLFLSSGVIHTPDYTMEKLYETLLLLREKYHFCGYMHVKLIPGADTLLVEKIGYLADRVSCNLELPTAEGLRTLAPAKSRQKILTPMRHIQNQIASDKLMLAECGARLRPLMPQLLGSSGRDIISGRSEKQQSAPSKAFLQETSGSALMPSGSRYFVPAGQSTQMIIGATGESDYEIISVSESLYRRFEMRRVFYSAYIALNEDSRLPSPDTKPPLLREHRLYQADWLLRFYGFTADELLDKERPNFNRVMDPKCDWAIRHLEHFPVEVNKADYKMLLRVPGIGVQSARRICKARRFAALDFDDLKKLGIVLKRAVYFITCKGRQFYPVKLDEDYITRNMIDFKDRLPAPLREAAGSYRQLSLFDDWGGTP